MRDSRRPQPTRDLDTPEEIAEVVRRFSADVARVHSQELLGHAVSIGSDAAT